MRSSEREGAEPDPFAQEVCRETPLEKTHVTNEEYVEAMWKSFGRTALFAATSFHKKTKTQTEMEKNTQTSSSSERPWSEVLWLRLQREASCSKINISSHSRRDRWQLRVRLTHSCRKIIKQNHPCSPTQCFVWELGSRRQHNVKNRWTKRRQEGELNISKGTNDKFLDYEFNVNPGFTSEQLLAKIKHHGSSIVDDFGQVCTPERTPNASSSRE